MAAAPIANDRFKQSSRSSFWISLTVATLLHAAAFAGSPVFALDVDLGADDETEITVLPPQVRMPEPPPPIDPPAAPSISDLVAPDVTLDPVTPEEWKRAALAPPPPPADGGASGPPTFTPMDVAPRLLNSRAVQSALRNHYPPVLRDASVGGVVSVWFHIDERGRVTETRIHRSSGYDLLDRAALVVADEMQFSPAMNRDRRIPVWVALEIRFEAQ